MISVTQGNLQLQHDEIRLDLRPRLGHIFNCYWYTSIHDTCMLGCVGYQLVLNVYEHECGYTLVYMGLYGYTWVYVGEHVYTWVYVGIRGYMWVYKGIHGYTWVYVGIHG